MLELLHPIDIVMTSRNRYQITRKTIEAIFERTRNPYLLHVIDDNSHDETVDYLLGLWRDKKICDLVLRGRRAGIHANDNVRNWIAFSDPFVIMPDDALCPDVEPDWLERGVRAIMERDQGDNKLGELDLNHPGAYRIKHFDDGVVTYCQVVGGGIGFVRRSMVPYIALAHFRDNFGGTNDIQRCDLIRQTGCKVGYLTETFTYHLGRYSEIENGPAVGRFIEPVDWKTLRPPEEWVWA